jgi:DNA invertase Pin-like site-specific DNA recombinase
MAKPKRAALYVRVSTDAQTVENQISELREVAERRGWQVVEIYKGRYQWGKGQGPATWPRRYAQERQSQKVRCGHGLAIDRIGRSLIDLLRTIQDLEAVGTIHKLKREMAVQSLS